MKEKYELMISESQNAGSPLWKVYQFCFRVFYHKFYFKEQIIELFKSK